MENEKTTGVMSRTNSSFEEKVKILTIGCGVKIGTPCIGGGSSTWFLMTWEAEAKAETIGLRDQVLRRGTILRAHLYHDRKLVTRV